MIVDPETGLKKLNKIWLKDATDRNDAIKAMYDLLKSIKDLVEKPCRGWQNQGYLMKHRIFKGFWFVVLFTLGTFLPVHAQSNFTTLWSFDFIDGAWPQPGLILSGNTLYGTTDSGGGSYASYGYGYGTVFSVNTNGTDFTDYRFTGGSDGAHPSAGLILSGNTLYGTTKEGGSSSNGMIFAVNTDGTDFTILYSFTETSSNFLQPTNSDGANPNGLILSGNMLYGTTYRGGSSGGGTVFSVNTNGTGFTTLCSLTGGANPVAGLILSGNTLYGTASGDGINDDGTVFAVNTDGTGFTNLYSFTGGSDGGAPYAGLILSGNTLYGTTAGWGYTGSTGTVFAVNTDGTGFKTLHTFSGSDGAYPEASLILSGNTLYGTTSAGGISNNGTVFAVNTDGTGFTTLYAFTNGDDGANPNGLILSGNTLYGTTEGGANGDGTIFALRLPLVDNVTATAVEHSLFDIVTLSCDTEGAKIEYQIQPGHAAANGMWKRYSSPIYVFHIETKTLYCRAVKGRTTSAVTSFVYTGNSRYNR